MIEVILYTRESCHLCEEVKTHLFNIQERVPHLLVEIDIEQDEKLHQQYWDKIPVVEAGPYKLTAPIDPLSLEVTLGAASDRAKQMASVELNRQTLLAERSKSITKADRLSFWLSNHYMAVFNVFVFIYVGLPFLAPVFMKANLPGPANLIYTAYRAACHQLAYRSFFVFGQQPIYPAEAANLNAFSTYEEVSGLNPQDLIAGREFIGDKFLGYKIAFCQRDIGIWAGVLAFGIVFSVTGRKIKPLPFVAWVIIGMLPIGLDGGSQLLSQLPIEWMSNLVDYRESSPMLRLITGSLFGITTAWFGYPNVETAMADTRNILKSIFDLAPSILESADK